MRNYYGILGIPPSATEKEIKAAYHFSIKAFHPDKFAGSSLFEKARAEERTKAVNEAYSTLIDPVSRARYDRLWRDHVVSDAGNTQPKSSTTATPDPRAATPPPPPPPRGPTAASDGGTSFREQTPNRGAAAASSGQPTRDIDVWALPALIATLLLLVGIGIATTNRKIHMSDIEARKVAFQAPAAVSTPTLTASSTPVETPIVLRALPVASESATPTGIQSSPQSWAAGAATPNALPIESRPPIPQVFRPKLTFAPRPTLPYRIPHSGRERIGRFRVHFASSGVAATVQILQSTGNSLLDRTSVNSLLTWRCEPGREGDLVVPVDYQ